VRVRFTPSARAQFLNAVSRIRDENRSAAVRFRKRVEKAVGKVRQFPHSGRVVPEFPDLPYRETIVPPYRLFYRVVGKTIWIVAVWHGAQLPQDPES
jgi:plasmid stabilization system protein ParE